MEKMAIDRIQFMRLVSLPGSPGPGFQATDLQRKSYEYWKSFWQELLNTISPGEKLNSEHFFDQDVVNVILEGNSIVAMQSIKHYDLRCGLKDHSVFSPFSSGFWNALEERKIERVVSFRWFRVDDAYSPRKTGQNFSAISNELMHRVFDTRYAAPDLAGIAHSRVDVPAASVAKKIGWQEVAERQELHGVPCAQLALFGKRGQYNEEVQAISDMLWKNRTDLTVGEENEHARAA